MPANVLQRELDAYGDVIDKYNRQGQKYKASGNQYNALVAEHNKNVDAYKQFYEQKTAGDYNEYSPQVFFAETKGRYLIRSDMMQEVQASDLDKYYVRHLKDNQYVLIPKQANDMASPGAFTLQPPTAPTQPGPAPEGTVGQMRRLDEPSLVDVERAGDKGLISKAFNF